MATLCLLNDDGSWGQEWELGDKALTVGRGDAADIQIDDNGLSRRHFSIYRENGAYWIRDLSSRNGTWVDGHRAQAAALQHDARILAGCTQFRFAEPSVTETNGRRPAKGPNDTVIIPVGVLKASRRWFGKSAT